MADIPVEKKGSSSIWPWIIGLLVLLALVVLFFQIFVDEEDEVDVEEPVAEQVEPSDPETPEPTPADAAAAGGLITSVSMLIDAQNPAQLAGREVQLSDMRVESVLGDSAFYVRPQDDDRRFLVALNEVIPDSPPGTEGRYDVTAGQLIDIDGGVRELTREAEAWDLTDEQADAMQNDAIYVRAQRLTIVEPASS